MTARVDTRFKILPLEIHLKIPNHFIILISFNKIPTLESNCMRFENKKLIKIPKNFQSEIVSNYSIKLKILCEDSDLNGEIKCVYKGFKKIVSYIAPQPISGKDFSQFLNLDVHFPSRVEHRSRRNKSLSLEKVEKNKEMVFCRKKDYMKARLKERSKSYAEKLKNVIKKKKSQEKALKNLKIENQDKFLKLKKKVKFFFNKKEI